jgi:hypothetical protein
MHSKGHRKSARLMAAQCSSQPSRLGMRARPPPAAAAAASRAAALFGQRAASARRRRAACAERTPGARLPCGATKPQQRDELKLNWKAVKGAHRMRRPALVDASRLQRMHSSPPSTTATRIAATCGCNACDASERSKNSNRTASVETTHRFPVGSVCFVHARQCGPQQHRRRQRGSGVRCCAHRRGQQRRGEAATKQRADARRRLPSTTPRRGRAPHAVPSKQQRLRLTASAARRGRVRRPEVEKLKRSVPLARWKRRHCNARVSAAHRASARQTQPAVKARVCGAAGARQWASVSAEPEATATRPAFESDIGRDGARRTRRSA